MRADTMHTMPSEEFDALPPALKRKFFSNAERLRMRLAQNDIRYHRYCHAGPDYPLAPASSGVSRCLHLQTLRRRPALCSLKVSSNSNGGRCHRLNESLSCESSTFIDPASSCSSFSSVPRSSFSTTSSRCAHKPHSNPTSSSSLQLAYLFAQAESQCFHSLPSKIQQKYFSPEERAYLRQAYRQSVILDAADEAVYRHEKEIREQEDTPSVGSTLSSGDTAPPRLSQSSAFYLEESDSDWGPESDSDNEDDDDNDNDSDNDDDMDESLYDSFRWLDEDADLDLTLDEYHKHVANTVPKLPPRRKPSFRRTMTFSTANRAHRATSSVSGVPTSSHSSTVPSSLAHIVGRNSISRPSSVQQGPVLHAPRASTSSIDPSAQYYQDPEARLKLRVYLATPQKFDEAVEFGFPALDDSKEDNARPEKVPEYTRPVPKVQKGVGTFLEDENGSVHGQRLDKAQRKSSRFSVIKGPQSPAIPAPKRQSVPATQTGPRPGPGPGPGTGAGAGAGAGPRRLPGNREMTLKMTLTRPDLRTDSPSASPTSAEDPLKLEELPPADVSPQTWDDFDSDQHNVVKKMWRKLRKPKN